MTTLNLTQNNLVGLTTFMQTADFQALSTEEKAILTRYAGLERTGTLDRRTVVQISNPTDPTIVSRAYPGGGTAKATEDAFYIDGMLPRYIIAGRPYLFLHLFPYTTLFR